MSCLSLPIVLYQQVRIYSSNRFRNRVYVQLTQINCKNDNIEIGVGVGSEREGNATPKKKDKLINLISHFTVSLEFKRKLWFCPFNRSKYI